MFLLATILSILPLLASSQCLVEPSEDNVVSTQLEGSWIPDGSMNAWFSPSASLENDIREMKFYKNSSVEFPVSLCENLRVYMEGEMTLIDDLSQRDLYSYILTSIDGNPHILFYDKEYDLYQSFNVMLARAENSQDDILFTGDDHNTEGFIAWKRQID